MQIRLTTDRTDRGHFQRQGDVIDVDAKEAARLLNARQAETLDPEGEIETAAKRRRKR